MMLSTEELQQRLAAVTAEEAALSSLTSPAAMRRVIKEAQALRDLVDKSNNKAKAAPAKPKDRKALGSSGRLEAMAARKDQSSKPAAARAPLAPAASKRPARNSASTSVAAPEPLPLHSRKPAASKAAGARRQPAAAPSATNSRRDVSAASSRSQSAARGVSPGRKAKASSSPPKSAPVEPAAAAAAAGHAAPDDLPSSLPSMMLIEDAQQVHTAVHSLEQALAAAEAKLRQASQALRSQPQAGPETSSQADAASPSRRQSPVASTAVNRGLPAVNADKGTSGQPASAPRPRAVSAPKTWIVSATTAVGRRGNKPSQAVAPAQGAPAAVQQKLSKRVSSPAKPRAASAPGKSTLLQPTKARGVSERHTNLEAVKGVKTSASAGGRNNAQAPLEGRVGLLSPTSRMLENSPAYSEARDLSVAKPNILNVIRY